MTSSLCSINADDYISQLEDYASRDLFDPSNFTFDQNLEYLDELVKLGKEHCRKHNWEEAYLGFRRYQIVLNCLQKHNLYDPNDPRIQTLNNVLTHASKGIYHVNSNSTPQKENSQTQKGNTIEKAISMSAIDTRHLISNSNSEMIYESNFSPISQSDNHLMINKSSPYSNTSPLLTSSKNQYDYILANLDTIPDVRNKHLHLGLPLPEDELDVLLSFDDE